MTTYVSNPAFKDVTSGDDDLEYQVSEKETRKAFEFSGSRMNNANSASGLDYNTSAVDLIPKSQPIPPFKRAIAQILITGIAVGMLWVSSLAVAQSVTGYFIVIPSFEAVIHSYEDSFNKVNQERETYDEQLAQMFFNCNFTLNVNIETEFRASTDIALQNNLTLINANAISTACGANYNDAITTLNAWKTNYTGSVTYTSNTNACSTTQHDDVASMVGDASTANSASYVTVSQYSSNSLNVVNQLADYGVVLTEYNADYLANKTGISITIPNIALNIGSVSLPKFNIPFTAPSLDIPSLSFCGGFGSQPSTNPNPICGNLGLYGRMQGVYQTTTNQYKAVVSNTAATFDTKIASLNSDLKQYTAVASQNYHDAKNFISAIQGLNIPGITVTAPSLTDITGFSLNQVDTYLNGINFATFTAQLPDVDMMLPTQAQLANLAQPAYDNMQAGLSSAQNATVATAKKYQSDINNTLNQLNSFFSDYNPPKLNITTVKSQNQQSSSTFLAQMAASLNQLSSFKLPTIIHANSTTLKKDFNATVAYAKAEIDNLEVLIRTTNFTKLINIKEPVAGGIDFHKMYVSLGGVTAACVTFDTVYRTFRTVVIIIRYFSKGFLDFPNVDGRIKSKAAADTASSFFRTLFAFAGPFFLPFVFFCGATVLLFLFALAIYLPWLEGYFTGCIYSPNTGIVQLASPGTILTGNLEVLAWNFATLEGNRQAASGFEAYNSQVTKACSQYGVSTTQIDQQNAAVLSQFQQNQAAQSIKVSEMRSCINVTSMQSQFANRPTVPLLHLDNSLTYNANKCDVSLADYSIRNSQFNCSVLPECELTTAGVDPQVIQEAALKTGCLTEQWFHTNVLTGSLAIIGYILLNVMRLLVVQGLMQIFYKYLHDGVFTYLADSDRSGQTKITAIGNDKEISSKFQIFLYVKISEVVDNFKKMGFVKLLVGLMVCIPWIICLIIISAKLDSGLSNQHHN